MKGAILGFPEKIGGSIGSCRKTARKAVDTVDGRNPAPVDRLFVPLFTGFIHPRWCRISAINSSEGQYTTNNLRSESLNDGFQVWNLHF